MVSVLNIYFVIRHVVIVVINIASNNQQQSRLPGSFMTCAYGLFIDQRHRLNMCFWSIYRMNSSLNILTRPTYLYAHFCKPKKTNHILVRGHYNTILFFLKKKTKLCIKWLFLVLSLKCL